MVLIWWHHSKVEVETCSAVKSHPCLMCCDIIMCQRLFAGEPLGYAVGCSETVKVGE